MKTTLRRAASRLSIPAGRSRYWSLKCPADPRRDYLGTRRECIAHFERMAAGFVTLACRMVPNR